MMKHLGVVLDEKEVNNIQISRNENGMYAFCIYGPGQNILMGVAPTLAELDVEMIDKVEEALYG